MLSRPILILLAWENLLIHDIGHKAKVLVEVSPWIVLGVFPDLTTKRVNLPFILMTNLIFMLMFFPVGCKEMTSCADNCSEVFCSKTIDVALVLS